MSDSAALLKLPDLGDMDLEEREILGDDDVERSDDDSGESNQGESVSDQKIKYDRDFLLNIGRQLHDARKVAAVARSSEEVSNEDPSGNKKVPNKVISPAPAASSSTKVKSKTALRAEFYQKITKASDEGGTTGQSLRSQMEVFLGPYVHSLSREHPFSVVSNGVIGVSVDGKIAFVDIEENLEVLKTQYGFYSDNIRVLGPGEFLMPGLIDTHIHAPQYPNAGLGLDLPLLDWLSKYTFPIESRFSDLTFARSVCKKVVQRTLNSGTTTATYFATIHREAAEILAEVCEFSGQRAFVGKVNMDCFSPDNYIEGTNESLKETENFIINVQKRKCSRVKPIITPRFALTCSEKLMRGLGDLAKNYDVNIQTHLCESEPEIERALELFPHAKNYTQIYDEAGLLTNKTILAHCVHLKEEEIEKIKETSSSIAHCPTSNMCLLSGLCPVRNLLKAGVKIGLGTDVSGGYSSSILEAMRHALIMSKCLNIQDPEQQALTYEELFYLATLGGAQALNIENLVGNFEVGKEFDALHIDLASVSSPMHIFPGEDLIQMVQKFIMLGDDRNIVQVYVQGKKVKVPVRPVLLV